MSSVDISVVIPSFNRGEVVRNNVQKLLSLEPGPREIILVDDHSRAESEKILRDLVGARPRVIYIRLPENGGQSVARSVGLATAKCKYVVSLDDDSWFIDDDALQRVWDRMESLPNCGVLAFETYGPTRTVFPRQDELFQVADHIACGAAFRNSVLRSIGYHLPFLRAPGEEADISIKAIGAGYDIILDRSLRVFHDYDPAMRSTASIKSFREFGVRNDLLQPVVHFHPGIALSVIVKRIASHLFFGVRSGSIGPTFRGYWGFVTLLPTAVRCRSPISNSAARKYLKLRKKVQIIVSPNLQG